MSIAMVALLIGIIGCHFITAAPIKPIVLWHGMGDSCCFSFVSCFINHNSEIDQSMGKIEELIRSQLNESVYIHSIRIGSNEDEDVENSYLMNSNKQIQLACEALKKDENLKDGFNAIGFSQGKLSVVPFVTIRK